MTRERGFPRADVDTAIFSDAKVKRLARAVGDPTRTAAFFALYLSVVMQSWHEGERISLDDSAPAWWMDPLDDALAALVAAELLDDEGKIPQHAFENWFGPARRRHEKAVEDGRKGGFARAASSAQATQEPSQRVASPLPTVLPSIPSSRADEPAPVQATLEHAFSNPAGTPKPNRGDAWAALDRHGGRLGRSS
jgi:hypothetical protein